MNRIKRFLKIIGFVLLIAVASVGMGITGAAPVNLGSKKRDDDKDPKIELVEERDEEEQDVVSLE